MRSGRWFGVWSPRVLTAVALTVVLVIGLLYGTAVSLSAPPRATASAPRYVVLGWNDLGMHCYNGSFADMMVLPPYNTLWAQVIEVGDPPRIVTSGVTVSYEFPGNTYSAGKTDFWQYATKTFGLPATLPPDVGLKGKGLEGAMDVSGDHFTAVGIPLTEYSDADTSTREPLQKAVVTVRDAATGAILTSATVVAPVSSEMNCVMCHDDGADATTRYPIQPTGDFQQNILALHDYLSQAKYPKGHTGPLLGRRPVLCAECHADNALGAKGIKGISSLSNAMHRHHNPGNAPDIQPNNDGCYCCHPGAQTQCLRCTMSQRYGIGCVDCHGDITQVAKNATPWLKEPKCGSPGCHGSAYASDQPLYRDSKGHGAVYCAACHDSPHAISPSREPNDGIKFMELQGETGSMRKCTTCHLTMPSAPFRHSVSTPGTFKGEGRVDSGAGSLVAKPEVKGTARFSAWAALRGGAKQSGGVAYVLPSRFEFHSASVGVVTLDASRLHMEGTGSAGSKKGCTFILDAVDGDLTSARGPDRLRLRVFAPDGSQVYDNAMGAEWADAPPAIVSGGVRIKH